MNQNDANSTPVPNDALLRFLDTTPRRAGHDNGLDAPSDLGSTHHGDSEAAREYAAGAVRGAQCGSAGDYLSLVLGTVRMDETERLLEHAATCAACGEQLAVSLKALEGNPSQEETEAIAALAATDHDWQQSLARQLAATPARKYPARGGFSLTPRRLFGGPGAKWRLAVGSAAAILVAAVALFVWQRGASSPEHELAQAYTQARTLELRIPEAAYAASVGGGHTRGETVDREPPALLEARAKLARELERSPQDPHWLQLQARADLLEERYDSAADVLDRLLASGPITAELLVDAASAYFQRGLVSGNQLDRSTALDYLRRADELSPADPVVLFNEAIVMEDRGQMMNAVEVWNRYITVERDQQWAAEGKRKLAALEQTLNRLKSHEGRVQKMLSSPAEMTALANDASRITALDEELSSMKLDAILDVAYPVSDMGVSDPGGGYRSGKDQARGSPCDDGCAAARRLLKTISTSLEVHHQDFWLSDLIAPQIDTLPEPIAILYAKALRHLGNALRDDITGSGAISAQEAALSQALFEQLGSSSHSTAVMATAAEVGRRRAAVEHLNALSRMVDFKHCRILAGQIDERPVSADERKRYPWIESARMVTEKNCDDTPETRQAGRILLQQSLQLAESSHYPLLKSRIDMRATSDAELTGDTETVERLTLAVQKELAALDAPAWRMANTLVEVCFVEQESPRAHMTERCMREAVAWIELSGNRKNAALGHLYLARNELRIGAMQEFNHQLKLAYESGTASGSSGSSGSDFSESELLIAQTMLERGDLDGARSFLDRASPHMSRDSDTWAERKYAADRGQLELSLQHYAEASSLLESEIRSSEGKDIRKSDRAFVAEYGAEDHDLYAELAAAWLAEGRSPDRVLALWERFRLRSRGLPIPSCAGQTLDCEQPALHAAQQQLGRNVLIGQILLLDRTLVYRVDQDGVSWTQNFRGRQDILDAVQKLERAVSSPVTTQATANQLGAPLAQVLLSSLPARMAPNASLMIEPDPVVENLSWPVLPSPSGPLGVAYPVEEVRSILVLENGLKNQYVRGQNHDAEPGSPLVVAASVVGEGEPPLPETLIEAENVKRYLRAPKMLLGGQATTADVGAGLASATVWHFAGHARQSGNGTELLLAEAGGEHRPWIDGAFLRSHPPRVCRLAILSACATGRREAAWNHPLQDIVATLESLGVPEVVATRWQIDSEASVPFMDNLYLHLAKGETVAMALSSARRVQSEKSLYKNPYYWGAYYLSGRENTITQGELHASFYKENEINQETAQADLRH